MTVEQMRDIKEQRGYSLDQLSKYSGVPLGTIQKIFSGETLKPRKATLEALERVLLGDEKIYSGKTYQYVNSSVVITSNSVKETSSYGSMKSEKVQGEYTTADYLSLPQDVRKELIDGVFYDMAAPSFVHQDILAYLSNCIYTYIRQNGGSCKVISSPSSVQLDEDDRTMVEPDLYVICDRNKIKGFGIFGAPDFVLEILSASTRKKDMTIKLAKYQNAGVREYWIVDPVKKVLITYNFMDENYIPIVHELTGKVGLAIYDEKLMISLEEVRQIILEAELLEKGR